MAGIIDESSIAELEMEDLKKTLDEKYEGKWIMSLLSTDIRSLANPLPSISSASIRFIPKSKKWHLNVKYVEEKTKKEYYVVKSSLNDAKHDFNMFCLNNFLT